MNQSENSGSTVMAFVVGSLAGLAAGMLFAPKSGQETRNEIKRRAQSGMNTAQDKIEEGKDAAGSAIDTAKDKAGNAVDTAKTVAHESKNAAKDAKDRIDDQT